MATAGRREIIVPEISEVADHKMGHGFKSTGELSKSLMVFTLTAIDDLVPIIYRL